MKRFYRAIDAASNLAIIERRQRVVDARAALASDDGFNQHLAKITPK